MTGDEISESAKAAQEIAKTTRTALEITKDFGQWVADLIAVPAGEAAGMLGDHMKVFRWERRQRLQQRVDKILKEREILESERASIPIKIALPAIEQASMEDSDELQDIWARLLATALDPESADIRSAYIEIAKQLEPVDAQILAATYNYCMGPTLGGGRGQYRYFRSEDQGEILDPILVNSEPYHIAVDNLIRLGCLGLPQSIWTESDRLG